MTEGFSTTYAEIEELIKRTALSVPLARAVARKAGLRQGAGSFSRTVFAAYIDPMEQPLARQWVTDLSGASRVMLQSRSNVPIYVFCSTNVGSNALDPGDYVTLRDPALVRVSASASSEPAWRTLPINRRVPLRLTIGTDFQTPSIEPIILDGPFFVSLRAAT